MNNNNHVRYKDLVDAVSDKLPTEIDLWARNNIVFGNESNDYYAQTSSTKGKEWIVTIRPSIFKLRVIFQHCVIAHEIAHAKLGYKTFIVSKRREMAEDKEADDLAQSWGFPMAEFNDWLEAE